MSTKQSLIALLLFSLFVFVFSFNALVYYRNDFYQPLLWKGIFYGILNPQDFHWELVKSAQASAVFAITVVASSLLKKKGSYGDARFARMSDVKKFTFNMLADAGLLIAKFKGKYLRNDDNQSILIAAPQGAGKSAGSLIPMMLSYQQSMLSLDVKGELWNTTSKQRSQFSTCRIFSPIMGMPEHEAMVSWNPLDKSIIDEVLAASKATNGGKEDFNRVIEYVIKITKVIFPTAKADGNAKYFISRAGEIFTHVAIYNIRLNGGTSIPAVFDEVMATSDIKAKISEIMDMAESIGDTYSVTKGNSLLSSSDDSFSDFTSTFGQTLDLFVSPIARKSLESCDFTARTFRESPFSLYLHLPTGNKEQVLPIFSLLITYLTGELLTDSHDKEKDQQITFFLDEFYQLGKMQEMVDMPTLGRSYGLRVVYAFQNFGQMVKVYGKDIVSEMMSSADIKIIYQQNETETAKRFSDTIGKTTRKRRSRSHSTSLTKDQGSQSTNEEGVPLMLPQDFLNLKQGEVVVIAKGHAERPIKAKSLYWEKEASMKHLGGYAYDFEIK
ncbi:type IV secretory system conjugative DNA transfer family protein [Vibrio sp. 10N.261.46.A3]|uniref:type IV secretory system conjugative DNA transfer family protein n=1 Tax=Vibrio sp. 10N.261.46.A3 TaxID=3229658 RepID=UPI00354F54C3